MEEEMVCIVEPHVVEIPARSLPFQKVTIYENQAEVKLLLNLHLPAGEAEIRITNLLAFWKCIRVEGQHHQFVSSVRVEHLSGAPLEDSPEVAEARSKYQKLKRHYLSLLDDKDIVKRRISALDFQISYSTLGEKGQQPYEFIESSQNYYVSELKKLNSENMKLNDKLNSVNREVQAAFKELTQAEECIPNTSTVTISLDFPGGDVELTVAYVTTLASWSPKYAVYIDTTSSTPTAEVCYLAAIKHETENWINAPIVVSTGKPDWMTEPPALKSAEFGQEPGTVPAKNKRKRRDSHGQSESESGDTHDVVTIPEKRKERKLEFAVQKPQTFLLELATEVEIGSFKAEPSLIHHCFLSRDDSEAHLTAQICNNSDFTLLPGSVFVFLNDSFVIEHQLKETVMPMDKFRVNLGADPLVKLSSVPSSQNSLARQYLQQLENHSRGAVLMEQVVVVMNNRNAKILLELKDSGYQKSDEHIKATLLSSAVYNDTDESIIEKRDLSNGTYQFAVSVNPTEEKTIYFEYFGDQSRDKDFVLVDSE